MSALTRVRRAVERRYTGPNLTSWLRAAGELLLAAGLAAVQATMEAVNAYGDEDPVSPLLVPVVVVFLLRRRLPGISLLAAAALCGAYDAVTLLLVAASWSAGEQIRGAVRASVFFSLAFALYATLDLWLWWEQLNPVSVLYVCLVFLLSGALPGLANRYWTQRFAMYQTVQEHEAQLLRERQMLADQVRLRERQRIAQDLHDSLGHQLALIALHTGALEVDQELTGRQREAVEVLRTASTAAMHELRAVVTILSEESSQRAQAKGVAGIESLVESAGGEVRLERCGERRPLAPAADHAAYRVAHEGLTNAYKHAPGAPITVSLRYEPDSLVVEVSNGPVPRRAARRRAVVSGRQGLTSLRERALLVGGMLYAGPTDDDGFRIAGMFPYAPARPWTLLAGEKVPAPTQEHR
ncbi:histidine kinase [Streptomyces sp. NPDC004539]|uniref:sensor histidine kinase n=1 Tax=Streptomyces sp. NPDC004539 TaxID=3154280 RepID=UPI0033BEF415